MSIDAPLAGSLFVQEERLANKQQCFSDDFRTLDWMGIRRNLEEVGVCSDRKTPSG